MREEDAIAVRLLTLLNVSATKASVSEKGDAAEKFVPAPKLNKRKAVEFAKELIEGPTVVPSSRSSPLGNREEVGDNKGRDAIPNGGGTEGEEDEKEEDDNDVGTEVNNSYDKHFGVKPVALTDSAKSDIERRDLKSSRESLGRLGKAVIAIPQSSQERTAVKLGESDVLERLSKPFKERQARQPAEHSQLQNDLISTLSTRRDLYLTTTDWNTKKATREAISLHVINHITRKRRRVLKNNERIASATTNKISPPEDVQDQGFTRPSVLILLPFRNSALDWFRALTSHTPSPGFQIENSSRFTSEYGLPAGATDKLTSAEPGTYPRDHVEIFKGNVDDNFRVGIKMTKKTVKMFSEFFQCDIIMASPLGIRRSIEKEDNADYLSSIEVLIIDQGDALLMQNWEHVKLVLSHLNKIPKEPNNTDFSRIKPWYLDDLSSFLRQSIILTAYETPELRSLYNTGLKNVSGKIRQEKVWPPVQVPEGVEPSFVHFECSNPVGEADKRFNYFTTQILPNVLRSAVQSINTIIFIPSSFDFIRVHNYFRKNAGVPFDVLSEYSTNQDISRARGAFFSGKKAFLLVSERFHFYKRYKIRGIRNLIFYGPPDHPQFFAEYLSYPFLDEGVDPSDVTCKVLYSKYDWFRLERILGTEGAVGVVKAQ